MTVGTSPGRLSIGSEVFGPWRRRLAQELAAKCKRSLTPEVGHKAKVTDTDKAFGQDVRQEAADELVRGESHDALSVAGLAVDPSELNLIAVEADQPVVGDGHPMGITAQITENLCGSSEGRLGIDDPVMDVKSPDPGTEALRIFQCLKLWRETDLAGGDQLFESIDELAAKNRAEYTARQ